MNPRRRDPNAKRQVVCRWKIRFLAAIFV